MGWGKGKEGWDEDGKIDLNGEKTKKNTEGSSRKKKPELNFRTPRNIHFSLLFVLFLPLPSMLCLTSLLPWRQDVDGKGNGLYLS